MDAPFPRGKGDAGEDNRKNKRNDKGDVEGDLFKVKRLRKVETSSSSKKKSSGTKRKRDVEKSNLLAAPLPEAGLGMTKSLANNKVVKIDPVSFKSYTTGSKALGYVLQVHDDAIVISLPGGVSGTVPSSEVSDLHFKASKHQLDKAAKGQLGELSKIVKVLMPVRCYVVSTPADAKTATQKRVKGRKVLNLSIRPSYINRGLTTAHIVEGFPVYGTVSSIEDRMYMISTGISGFTFILPFSSVPSEISPLQLGQPIESVVESINSPAKTVTLRAKGKAVSNAVTKGVKLTFSSLQPGMLVKTVLDKVVENGLIVGFFGLFFGTIDCYSLSRLYTGKAGNWKTRYEEGGVTTARIVFIDYASKSIRLSLRPHVVEYRAPNALPSLGEELKAFEIRSVVKRTGLYLTSEVDEEDSDMDHGLVVRKASKKVKSDMLSAQRKLDESAVKGVFIHKSSLAGGSGKADKDTREWESQYRVGKKLDARVSGYHLVEGICIASNVEAYMSGSVVHSSQVEVGQVLEVEIVKCSDFGLVVLLGGKVRAICPAMHLSDTAGPVITPQLMKKYKPGQCLTMRVWEAKGNQIVMTNKKSIVQAENAIVSYAQAIEGSVAFGIVSQVSQSGLQIHFFNKVKGQIPSSILVKQGVADIEESYRVGQVVKCFVLQRIMPPESSKKINATLILGLDIGDVSSLMEKQSTVEDSSTSAEEDSSSAQDSAPDLVKGEIFKIEKDAVHVRLDNGSLGLLHKDQLCDLSKHSAMLFERANEFLSVGKSITAVHMGSSRSGSVNISMKPLFLSATGANPFSSSHFSNIHTASVSIPAKIGDVTPGQVVAGTVWKVENFGVLVKFRCGMTALAPRPNVADSFISSPVGLFDVGDSVRCVVQRVDLNRERTIVTLKPAIVPLSDGCGLYTISLLNEQFRLNETDIASVKWKEYEIGKVFRATISAVKSYGVVLTAADGATMMLAKKNANMSMDFGNGDSVDALVLDVDFENKVLDVSIDPSLVKPIKKLQSAAQKDHKKSKKKASSAAEFTQGEICHDCVVVLVKNHYFVAIAKGVVCFVMVADYHCPYKTTLEYEVNQKVSIKIERCLDKDFFSYLPEVTAARDSPYSMVLMGSPFEEENEQRKQSKTLRKEAQESDVNSHSQFALDSMTTESTTTARQKFVENVRVGAVLKWEVTEVDSTAIRVVPENYSQLNINVSASIHLSCAIDHFDGCDDLEKNLDKAAAYGADSFSRKSISKPHPFYGITRGSKLNARIVQVRHVQNNSDSGDNTKQMVIYLSYVPANVKSKNANNSLKKVLQWTGRDAVKTDTLYAGAVTSINDTFCTVALSPYISARMSILDISEDIKLIEKFRDHCYVGMKLICAVTSITLAKQRSSVCINRACVEKIASGALHVDMTKNVSVDLRKYSAGDQLSPGDVVLGVVDLSPRSFVKKPPALPIVLANGSRGRVCVTEIHDHDSWMNLSDIFAKHAEQQERERQLQRSRSDSNVSTTSDNSVSSSNKDKGDVFNGMVAKCLVLSTSPTLELSMRPSRVKSQSKTEALKSDSVPEAGSIVEGFVVNTTSKGCFVRLTSDVVGRVLIKELSDEFVKSPESEFPPGKLVHAKVLNVVDKTHGDSANAGAIFVDLSLRKSAVSGAASNPEFGNIEVGSVVTGKVHRVAEFGVFVAIDGTSLIGLSRKGMAVTEEDNLFEVYEEGDHVRAIVLGKSGGNKIALGLKSSYFSGDAANNVHNDDDEDDSTDDDDSVEGAAEEISSEEDHESENSDDVDDDDDDDGDDDDSHGSAELGNDLLAIDDANSGSDSDDEIEGLIKSAALHTGDTDDSSDDEAGEELPSSKRMKTNEHASADTDEEESSDDEKDNATSLFSSTKQPTQPSMMMNWGDKFKPASIAKKEDSDNSDGESSSDESDPNSGEDAGSGHTGRRKASIRRKEEEMLRQKEEALLNGSSQPSSAAEFERILITQPNSSLLWIQYMSFYMLAADIESARGVAKRALRTINYREEDEKYNVWVALVNLEHKYGTMASLEKCFKQGIAESKGKYLHIHLAELYDQADDVNGARMIFERALKKHKTSKKVWMAYQHFELRRGNDKEARTLLGRSMQSLSRHKHVEVILKFASLLFELKKFETGREVFEDLLQSYPKKTDIWNVFVDKEVKYGNYDNARRLFERMICLKLGAKSIKAIFKKYLTFELAHGTVAEQNGVKQKAREYVESLM